MTRTLQRDTPPSHCTSLSSRPGTPPPSPRHTADPATRYRCYFLHSVLKQSCTFVPLMTRSGYYRSVCSPGVWCRLCCSLCRWIETISIIDAKRVSFNLSDDWLGVDVLLPDVDLHDLQHLAVSECEPGCSSRVGDAPSCLLYYWPKSLSRYFVFGWKKTDGVMKDMGGEHCHWDWAGH